MPHVGQYSAECTIIEFDEPVKKIAQKGIFLDTFTENGCLTMRSAIVLAGGASSRMNGDKGMMSLGGVPLTVHAVKNISDSVDEVLLVLGSKKQLSKYSGLLGSEARLIIDIYGEGTPLIGALSGFEAACGEYALVTACDMPFVSQGAVGLLFEEAKGHDGAFFEWPNGWIEPLLAVYRVKPSLMIARELYRERDLRLRMVLRRLSNAASIPMAALKEIDPDLLSLFDADTEESLAEAERILNKKRGSQQF